MKWIMMMCMQLSDVLGIRPDIYIKKLMHNRTKVVKRKNSNGIFGKRYF